MEHDISHIKDIGCLLYTSASEIREQSEAKKLKAALKHQEKRYAELDILLKKVYELSLIHI